MQPAREHPGGPRRLELHADGVDDGANLQTPVTYDVSANSDGCYKATAPPSFVGQQTMRTPAGNSVVNPLFTLYSCFNTF